MVFDRWHEVIQNWESLEVGGKGDLLSLADAVLLRIDVDADRDVLE